MTNYFDLDKRKYGELEPDEENYVCLQATRHYLESLTDEEMCGFLTDLQGERNNRLFSLADVFFYANDELRGILKQIKARDKSITVDIKDTDTVITFDFGTKSFQGFEDIEDYFYNYECCDDYTYDIAYLIETGYLDTLDENIIAMHKDYRSLGSTDKTNLQRKLLTGEVTSYLSNKRSEAVRNEYESRLLYENY